MLGIKAFRFTYLRHYPQVNIKESFNGAVLGKNTNAGALPNFAQSTDYPDETPLKQPQ
jgi:hypothetical protein